MNKRYILILILVVIIFVTVTTAIIIRNKSNDSQLPNKKIESFIVKPFDKNVEYNENVYMITGNEFIIDDEKIMLNDLNHSLKEGDILIGKEAPGFLRLIKSVNLNVLFTEKLEIYDVINNGKRASLYSLNTDVYSMNQEYNMFSPINSKETSIEILKKKIQKSYNIPFTKTISLTNSSYGTTGDLELYGNLNIVPILDLVLDISLKKINTAKIELTININGKIGEKLKADFKIPKNIKTNFEQSFTVTKWTVPVFEGVWIIITPSFIVGCDLEMEANVEIDNYLTIDTLVPYKMGFNYINGNAVSSYTKAEFVKKITTVRNTVSGHVIINPYIGILTDFMLYGVTGPFFSVNLRYKYAYYVTYELCYVTLNNICKFLRKQSSLSFDSRIGGKFLKKILDYPMYTKEWTLD